MRLLSWPAAGRATSRYPQTALLAGSLILGAAACRGGFPKQMQETAPEVCTGTEYLLVRNETGGPVDIFLNTSWNGTAEWILGTANAGASEYKLPERVPGPRSFNGRTPSGGYVRASYDGQAGQARLSFRVVCRQNG